MKNLRTFVLAIVPAHWVVAIVHLVIVARMLPAPDNHVSWLAVVLLSCLHWAVFIALWMLNPRFTGLVSLAFFVAAMTADLYEHFLHASANNIFMAPPGHWTFWFDASVVVLLALEILGCAVGLGGLSGTMRSGEPTSERHSSEPSAGAPSSTKFGALV